MAFFKPLILKGGKKEEISAPDTIDPSVLGGGGKSMILSFASGGSKHVETNSNTYVSLAHFIYAGSLAVGEITKFNINAWATAASTVDVRLFDLTNSLVLAELTGISSILESNLQDMGTISNIPTTAAVIEIQGKRNTGGGSSALRIASLEIEY